MKLLYTAPRFHTNQAPIVKGLVEKGHEVRYFVVSVGVTEDHTYCEPLVLKPSKTTLRQKKKLSKTKTESEIESIIGGRFIPDFVFLKKAFEDYMPDAVICREKTNLTLCVKNLCDKHSIPCILYDQEPIYRAVTPRSAANTAKKNSLPDRVKIKLERRLNPEKKMLMTMRSTSGFPKVHITPVKYSCLLKDAYANTSDEKNYFVPFVAEPNTGMKRSYYRGGIVNILSVGKYREYKRMDILIDAVSELSSDISWRLTIVGQVFSRDEKEYFEKIKKSVKEKHLDNKVKLLSEVPYEKIGEIYSANDLFVLTSERDYANISVLEAMSYGMSVITTSFNGTASYIDEANCGAVFETENVSDLTKKLDSICREDIEALGQRAQEWIRNNCSFDSYENKMMSILENEF